MSAARRASSNALAFGAASALAIRASRFFIMRTSCGTLALYIEIAIMGVSSLIVIET
jgi:hypothetical protein